MKKTHRSLFAVLACLLALVFSVSVFGACGNETAGHSDPTAQSGGVWYYGAATPADTLGASGDYYFNTTTRASYIKEDETWRIAENGEAGYLYSGTSAPNANLGSVNDFYINETTGELYQKKSQDSWGDPILTLKGEKGRDGVMWFSGDGAPSNVDNSIVGDFYLDKLTFDVYQKTGENDWIPLGSIEGRAGTAWFHGKELPEENAAAQTSNLGDFYMRHFDPIDGYMGYQIYSKEAEGWEMIANCAACYTKGTSHEFGEDNFCKYCGLENIFTDPSYFGSSSETEDEVVLKKAPTDVKDVVVPGTMNGKKVSIQGGFMENNTTVESVTLESGITDIKQYAFRGCTNLETVNLPDTLESLESSIFAGCSSLKSLVVPASVKEVESTVFVYGSGKSAIEEIIFEESGSKLEKLHFSAFQGCTNLKKLVLPEHSILYTSYGSAANDNTYFLRDTVLYADENNWVDDGNGNKMLYINNHLIAAKVNATDKQLPIFPDMPEFTTAGKSIEKLTIREGTHDIASQFLVGNSLSTSIIEEPLEIPDSVEIISTNTFKTSASSNTSSGTRVWVKPVFGTNSKLRYIDEYAFYGVFGGATVDIVLPKTVEYIGMQAFGHNSTYNFTFKLTTADNLKYIAADAFSGSKGLQCTEDNYGRYVGTDSNPYLILVEGTDKEQTSFTVNENTKFILAAFKDIGYKITEFHIGSKVESIGSEALGGCSLLKNLTIPASVKHIGKQLLAPAGQDTCSITIEGGGKWYYATDGAYPDDGILGEIPESVFVSPTEIGNIFVYYTGNPFTNRNNGWVRVTD